MAAGMNRLLIKNGTVVTLENPNRILEGHSILIEDGRIRKIAPRETFRGVRARVVDARGKVVMPGFINAHSHFYSSFARGLTKVQPAGNFTEVLKNLWWRLDRQLTAEDCHASALVAGLDAIRHGTTTLFDHHASPGAIPKSLDAIARAVERLGLRASLCYEVSDRDGNQAARQGIEENVRFVEECPKSRRLKPLFGLHASFTLSKKTLRRCVDAGRGCGFHIHCAEDRADQKITRQKYRTRVVDRLLEAGILGPKTICAHAVHLEDEEWDLLWKTDTAVVHNPQSNMNNAVGTMDLLSALEADVLVGLGTDAMTGNMLEELRSALWAQRLLQKHPGVAFQECVDLLLRNNQEIARRHFDNLGQIRAGWAADLICIDYLPPTPLTADTFAGHLVFGLSQATIDTTIVDGDILMENRRFTMVDEAKVAAEARKLSRALWERF
jgi:putative selenium metabolism protein SsnA